MSGEVTLEQVLALVPDLVLTGLYCNTENLKDGSGEIPVIEMEVSPRNEKRRS